MGNIATDRHTICHRRISRQFASKISIEQSRYYPICTHAFALGNAETYRTTFCWFHIISATRVTAPLRDVRTRACLCKVSNAKRARLHTRHLRNCAQMRKAAFDHNIKVRQNLQKTTKFQQDNISCYRRMQLISTDMIFLC